MHRFRLCGLLIDTPLALADQAVTFWAAALGATPDRHQEFTGLDGAHPGLDVSIQAVDDEPRYHLDIETDDVAAEAQRWLALGATEIERSEGCVILRAPSGHLLCIVAVQSDPEFFATHATTIA
jgi:hypothetical protein